MSSAQRAARLVQQLLDFSRKSIRRPQQLDLAAFIEESVEFLGHTIPENIQIHVEVSPAAHLIEADPTQIHQLLTNLAVNARDAMPSGGELTLKISRPEVEGEKYCAICTEAIAGTWECIEVIDTGSGIPPDIVPHIFEPFFTTKEVGEGTGLGLSQVYGIVTQHEGHITVNTQVGQGTSFVVYLPPVISGKDGAAIDASAAMSLGQGETILLVEDDPSVLDITRGMLNHLGYQVVTAMNGQEALTVYADRQDEIALVLSDVVMPDMEGMALFDALKTERPDVKVVMMSGYPLGQKGAELLAQGVMEWFQKPVPLQELARIIHRAVSNRRGRWG
jgi:CheY-like chemotaxis protein